MTDDDRITVMKGKAAEVTKQLRRALAESKEAYAFNPNSRTYSTMSSLIAAQIAWEAAVGPDDFIK